MRQVSNESKARGNGRGNIRWRHVCKYLVTHSELFRIKVFNLYVSLHYILMPAQLKIFYLI